jgi:hypothetical protein
MRGTFAAERRSCRFGLVLREKASTWMHEPVVEKHPSVLCGLKGRGAFEPSNSLRKFTCSTTCQNLTDGKAGCQAQNPLPDQRRRADAAPYRVRDDIGRKWLGAHNKRERPIFTSAFPSYCVQAERKLRLGHHRFDVL